MRTSEVLEKALALLDEGRAWAKYAALNGPYCMFGALSAVRGGDFCDCDTAKDEPTRLLCEAARVAGIYKYEWNDAPERTFADIKGAFVRAIDKAKREEASTDPRVTDETVVKGVEALLRGAR